MKFIELMPLLADTNLPEGWLYELRLDGYRAISFKTGGTLHLRSRNDNDFKELDPIPQFQATGKLAGFLQSAVAPA
jgi:bifunctional non-homologous end joining protein LigD